MLTEWQNKFPKIFEANPSIFSETAPAQTRLSNMLTVVEKTGLLNEETISALLTNYNCYPDELVNLIDKLTEYHCLNHTTLSRLFDTNLPEL